MKKVFLIGLVLVFTVGCGSSKDEFKDRLNTAPNESAVVEKFNEEDDKVFENVFKEYQESLDLTVTSKQTIKKEKSESYNIIYKDEQNNTYDVVLDKSTLKPELVSITIPKTFSKNVFNASLNGLSLINENGKNNKGNAKDISDKLMALNKSDQTMSTFEIDEYLILYETNAKKSKSVITIIK